MVIAMILPSVDRLMVIEIQTRMMPNDTRNDTSGQFAPKYGDEAFFDALRELEETGTREVAGEVGCDYDTARVRLQALAERDIIHHREVSNVSLWSLPEDDNGDENA
jgi:hypothetical protein